MRTGIIYKYTCPEGKVYIGQTINEKQRRKCFNSDKNYAGIKIDAARAKFGYNNFKYEVLFTEDSEDLMYLGILLNEKEMYYINQYNSIEDGYNIRGDTNNTIITIENYKDFMKTDTYNSIFYDILNLATHMINIGSTGKHSLQFNYIKDDKLYLDYFKIQSFALRCTIDLLNKENHKKIKENKIKESKIKESKIKEIEIKDIDKLIIDKLDFEVNCFYTFQETKLKLNNIMKEFEIYNVPSTVIQKYYEVEKIWRNGKNGWLIISKKNLQP